MWLCSESVAKQRVKTIQFVRKRRRDYKRHSTATTNADRFAVDVAELAVSGAMLDNDDDCILFFYFSNEKKTKSYLIFFLFEK